MKRLRIIPFLIFITIVICYAYFIHFIGVESWNATSRLDLVYSLAEQGTFRIDPYQQNTGDKVKFEGHYYSDKAPGVSLLALPGYLFLKWLGVNSEKYMRYGLTLMVIGIPSALAGVLFYGLTGIFKDVPVRLRVVVALAYALGTLAFPFSTVFYGHQTAAAGAIASFFILVRLKKKIWPERFLLLWLSGLLAGFSFLADFPAGIIMLLLAGYTLVVLRKKTGLIAWLVGAAIPVGFLFYYNNACFGSPFTSSYSLHQTYIHSAGLLGITWPKLDALWGITFSPYRGIFYQAPVLLFAIPGFYLFYRSKKYRPEFYLALLIVLGFFFFNAGYAYWDGVGSVGARFLIPALPFLALPLVWSVRKWPGPVTVLTFLSILIMVVIVATEPRVEWKVRSPLFYYNFFLLSRGYLSDNLGNFLGLKWWSSLLPLAVILGALLLLLGHLTAGRSWLSMRRREIMPSLGLLGMVVLWLVIAGWEEPCLQENDKAESLFRYFRGRGEVHWEEVERHYHLAIGADPRFMDPYLRLAEIARMQGRPRLALAYYRELLANQPDSIPIRREIARIQELMEEVEKDISSQQSLGDPGKDQGQ
ncbi:MAG: hypothetical protein RAO92_02510 [Candidatus Euphemobacter frigidus]|nr:hypothetical protein [Candidatus Euphemobacter frigidus]MDP8275256.1 hypothetical protein [Candidatus Euphemobacter frigidus]